MATVTINNKCNHCGNGFQYAYVCSLCPKCFVAGHRFDGCGPQCKETPEGRGVAEMLGRTIPSPPEDLAALERVEKLERRQQLESSLATAFCVMQRSYDAGERQTQWLECLRLCAELEKLNDRAS